MTKSLNELIEEINRLEAQLRGVLNEEILRAAREDIINLFEDAIHYLKDAYSTMDPWQKEHVVEAINAVYWDWLHLALVEIDLAIVEPETVAPENKYKDEIINLEDNNLLKAIFSLSHYQNK